MRPAAFVIALMTVGARLDAQDAWFVEIPTAAKVTAAYQASASRLGAARAAAALYSFTNLIRSLAGPTPSSAAQTRVAEFLAAKEVVLAAQCERDRDMYQVGGCQAAYQDTPEFHRELLDRFFSPQWLATYGPRLDPRRWRAALALPAGTRPATILSPKCGAGPVTAGLDAAQPAASAKTPIGGGGSVNKLLYAGATSLNAGDSTAALTAFREADRLAPNNPNILRLIGHVHFGQRNYDSALVHLQRVVSLDPRDFTTVQTVGRTYRMLGRHQEAVDALRKSIRGLSDPRWLSHAHYYNALSSLTLGQRDAAIESWRALSVLDTSLARRVADKLGQSDP